ncbi:MAG: class D sortase [Acidobacteriota bacterium]
MNIRINWHTDPPTRATFFLRWSQYLTLGIGVLLLGYCGFVLLDASLYQNYQSRRFQQSLKSLTPSNGGAENLQPSTLPPAEAESNLTRTESPGIAGSGGSALGRIEISAIGLDAMIMEGTDAKTLRRAVGHIAGTPLPGQRGNAAIAGHRDTFFRALRNIHEDDEITLTTLAGSYGYRVDSIKVVEPNDTAVLDNSDSAILTLVTCYPFYFVGPAPKRFVVRAHRVSGEALKPRMSADIR